MNGVSEQPCHGQVEFGRIERAAAGGPARRLEGRGPRSQAV